MVCFLIAISVIITSIGSPMLLIVIASSFIVGVVLWFFYIWLGKIFLGYYRKLYNDKRNINKRWM